ncbi:MAG TPA: glucosamine-6-phosphate deaminase [Polyangia bacterium]|nr:glucosamine-6-phosphate deaminase [Polyangia bacterium]
MEIVILPTPDAVCAAGAAAVARLLARKPDAVLGLPTGGTPRPLYAELVRRHRAEGLSFARATTFNLDEYVGVAPAHPGSFHRYMDEALFRHVDLPRARAHVPDGLAADLPAACAAYEAAIAAAGGLDLVLLGLGEDGHVAFNEPTSSLASRTRIKTLSAASRAANQAAFGQDPVPGHVVTMGVATILEARACLLLASGARKARALAAMVEGPVTSMVPASALQLHANATVLCDEAAAARLALGDYYREVQAKKPAWQR